MQYFTCKNLHSIRFCAILATGKSEAALSKGKRGAFAGRSGQMNCYDHPDRLAVTRCTRCGRPLCRECAERYTPVPVCSSCAQLEFDTRRKTAIRELVYMGIGAAVGIFLVSISTPGLASCLLGAWIGAGYVPAFQILRGLLQRALGNLLVEIQLLGAIGLIVVFIPAFFFSFVALPWQVYRCWKELKL